MAILTVFLVANLCNINRPIEENYYLRGKLLGSIQQRLVGTDLKTKKTAIEKLRIENLKYFEDLKVAFSGIDLAVLSSKKLVGSEPESLTIVVGKNEAPYTSLVNVSSKAFKAVIDFVDTERVCSQVLEAAQDWGTSMSPEETSSRLEKELKSKLALAELSDYFDWSIDRIGGEIMSCQDQWAVKLRNAPIVNSFKNQALVAVGTTYDSVAGALDFSKVNIWTTPGFGNSPRVPGWSDKIGSYDPTEDPLKIDLGKVDIQIGSFVSSVGTRVNLAYTFVGSNIVAFGAKSGELTDSLAEALLAQSRQRARKANYLLLRDLGLDSKNSGLPKNMSLVDPHFGFQFSVKF